MKKRTKIILIIVAILLVLQLPFFTPKINYTEVKNDKSITTQYQRLNNEDMDIFMAFHTSCYDCHSNKTDYPWYYHIQPVSWWMNKHIEEGKKHLNFSEFATLSMKEQAHAFHEIHEVMEEHEMPLSSYLWMHKKAKLSDKDYRKLDQWAQEKHDSLVKILRSEGIELDD